MTDLFDNKASNPLANAQRNLMGRTHYVDPDTLRFHKSRVLSSQVSCDGLLFGIVTSDALNYENTKRGFRYVIFDVFGTVISRPDLEHAFKTSERAAREMRAALRSVDAVAHTKTAIDKAIKRHADEMHELARKVLKIEKEQTAHA